MKKCVKCGQELEDTLTSCSKCGSIQVYPTVRQKNPNFFVDFLKLIFITAIVLSLWSMGMGISIFITIALITITIFDLLAVIKVLSSYKQTFYVMKCPHCNEELLFPVDEEETTCTSCKNKISLANAISQKAEEKNNEKIDQQN